MPNNKPLEINIDADLGNADWTKGTWDLLHIKGPQDLQKYLAKNSMSLEHFKKLPIYRMNVDKIDWLKEL